MIIAVFENKDPVNPVFKSFWENDIENDKGWEEPMLKVLKIEKPLYVPFPDLEVGPIIDENNTVEFDFSGKDVKMIRQERVEKVIRKPIMENGKETGYIETTEMVLEKVAKEEISKPDIKLEQFLERKERMTKNEKVS